MAPRASASRSDETALQFLSTAARLIDLGFVNLPDRGNHPTNTLKFPAAVDWLRVNDVVRLAARSGKPGASRKAFQNRWPDKDSFMRDALIYALCYLDDPDRNPNGHLAQLGSLFQDATSLVGDVRRFSNNLFSALADDPRTYLLIHLAPVIRYHPDVSELLARSHGESRQLWQDAFGGLLSRLGLEMRRGWTVEMFDLTLQAVLDGLLIRQRLQPEETRALGWEFADLFAEVAVAFLSAVITPDGDRASPEDRLSAIALERRQ